MTKQAAPFSDDAGIPVADPKPFLSYNTLALDVPGRPVKLQLKVSYPEAGTSLPLLLFSHGHGPSNFGSSHHAYGPLVEFWAARGFVVIQPLHLDASLLGRRAIGDPDEPLYATSRVHDMRFILDHLGAIERAVPMLANRVDHGRVAAAGHSLGGNTATLLLGAGMIDRATGKPVNGKDARIAAGVPIAAPGLGRDVDGQAKTLYPAITSTTFEAMTTPALVVVGENDHHPFFSSRKDWRSDAYAQSPGPKTKLTLLGAEHMLGGISGWDSAETTDASLERVATLRALVWAYLRSALYADDDAWAKAQAALAARAERTAVIESKSA